MPIFRELTPRQAARRTLKAGSKPPVENSGDRFPYIQPAMGERRLKLENRVGEIIESETFGAEEFDEFVSSMIDLLGGTEDREVENKWTSDDDPPLQDASSNAFFYFNISKKGENTIRTRYPNGSQILGYGISSLNDRRPEIRADFYINHPPMEFQYHSYLTGEQRTIHKQPIFPSEETIPLSDQQAQGVCKRIFSVYQESHQST